MSERQRRIALSRAKRLAASRLDILGVDFGVMYGDGRPRSKRHGIRFHVRRKLPLNELSAASLLPSDMERYPCDVIEASYQPHVSATEAVNPLQPGVSIGNVAHQSTGSLGAFVRDAGSGRTCVLSNWHVLCGSTHTVPGEPITQPGPRHLGTLPPRSIAQLLRFSDLSHGVDAAVAVLDATFALDPLPLGLTARATEAAEPAVGMHVVKSSAITGVTHAIVDGIDGAFSIDYSAFGDTRRWMDAVRLIADPAAAKEEISLAGDSGAVWLDVATNRAVGLHFAGEDGLGPLAEYALAHSLPRVLSALQVAWQS
jgi:hypothetical protein